jgi:hypothetical protein
MPPPPGEDPRLPSAARVACASRFSNSVGPVQIAGGLQEHTTIGAFYSTNATLVARYPNEWEFFGRAPPFRQDDAGPIDLGIEAGHSLAARGFVGELSLARRLGRVRLMALGRLLTDPDDHPMGVAAGGGAVPWGKRGASNLDLPRTPIDSQWQVSRAAFHLAALPFPSTGERSLQPLETCP